MPPITNVHHDRLHVSEILALDDAYISTTRGFSSLKQNGVHQDLSRTAKLCAHGGAPRHAQSHSHGASDLDLNNGGLEAVGHAIANFLRKTNAQIKGFVRDAKFR